MPNCHQCNTVHSNLRTVPTCGYCFSLNVDLCPNCAFWEDGPLPAPGAAAAVLSPAEQRQKDNIVNPCPTRARQTGPSVVSSRNSILNNIANQCDELNTQLQDAAFMADVSAATEIYDRVYYDASSDTAPDSDEAMKRREFHTMIVVALGALARAAYYKRDGPYTAASYDPDNPPSPPDPSTLLHRHDAPRLRARHLSACFFIDPPPPALCFIRPNRRQLYELALNSITVERLLRKKLSLAHAYHKYREIQATHGLDVTQIRSIIEVETVLYHVLTAVRQPDNRPGTFDPRRAHGWLSPEHKTAVLDNAAPPRLQPAATNPIDRLYMACSLSDVPAVRWPDPEVAANPLLTDKARFYLQSLPTFDNTASWSQCEARVRERVQSRLYSIFDHVWQNAAPASAPHRTINGTASPEIPALLPSDTGKLVECVPNGKHLKVTIPSDLFLGSNTPPVFVRQRGPGSVSLVLAKGNSTMSPDVTRIRILGDPSTQGPDDSLSLHYAIQGRDKYTVRKKDGRPEYQYEFLWVATAMRAPAGLNHVYSRFIAPALSGAGTAGMAPLVDALVADLRDADYWVESSHTEGLITLYANQPRSSPRSPFTLKSESSLRVRNENWRKILPRCPKSNPGSLDAEYRALAFHPNDLARRVDGRQHAKDWYLDWRVDKDRVMYDCSDFPEEELPVFTSLMPWDRAPEPNHTYGTHMVLWDTENLTKRAVMTVGDWGHPRRSRLLLLQDLLCGIQKKDGTDYNNTKRLVTLDRILRHLNANLAHPPARRPNPIQTLDAALSLPWTSSLRKGTQRYFHGDLMAMTTNDIENIECHVFGPVSISEHARIILVCEDKNATLDSAAPQKGLNKVLIAKLNAKRKSDDAPWVLRTYNAHGGDRPKLGRSLLETVWGQTIRTAILNRAPGQPPNL